MGIVCHKCGQEIIDGSLFCNKCGEKIISCENTTIPSNCETHCCISCGERLRTDSQYCGMCGCSKDGTPTVYHTRNIDCGPAIDHKYSFKANSNKNPSQFLLGKKVNFSFTNYFLEIEIPKKYNTTVFCIKYKSVKNFKFKHGFSFIMLCASILLLSFLFMPGFDQEDTMATIGILILSLGLFIGSFQTHLQFEFNDDSKYKVKLRKIGKKRKDDVQNFTADFNRMNDFYSEKGESEYVSAVINYGIKESTTDYESVADDIIERITN